MKIINKIKVVTFLFLASIIILLNSCEEEFPYGYIPPAVETGVASTIKQNTATVSGTVNSDGKYALVSRGICWGTTKKPTISNFKTADNRPTIGDFNGNLVELLANTTYYARAYATNQVGTAYGEEISFTTLEAVLPVLTSTSIASAITYNTAVSGGIITSDGGSKILNYGVCWSSTSNPTILNSKTNQGSAIGPFTSSVTDLLPSTTYYIKAYATNSIGTAYGPVITFKTNAAVLPIISATTSANSITQTTASSGGNITNDGGAAVTSRGICWSTIANPTIFNSKTIDASGIGSYTSLLTGLVAGTTYYIRAYATNSVGTAYGNNFTFTTNAAQFAVISTNSTSFITQNTAIGGGAITSDGGATITSRGVCWSTTTISPTITNPKTIDGTGIGSFTSSLTNLSPGTTYYVRAYATNSVGTTYGSYIAFTTTAATLPIVSSTTSISAIAQNTASGGGTISSDGGSTVTSRGVCFSSTTSNPTISSSITNNGSGIGSFTSSLTGLSENTTYYVRAYATNSVGTAYGSLLSFKTSASTLAAGQSYQGGIIAYIFQSGDSGFISGETHGLITTTSNQSTGTQWGCSGTSISTSTSFGTGQNNTTSIVNGCFTASIAARICNDLVSGGYSDWYLPSYYELQKLYSNRTVIGGFSSTYYWSSSQSTSTSAYGIYFFNGSTTNTSKTSTAYVRAIRKF
jgi:hypothetical protein